jgi:serine/threonine-protein kinase RsbW
MSLIRQDLCRQEAAQQSPGHDEWQRESIQSPAELSRFLATWTALVEGAGYSSADIFGMRLALEEAIVNGIKHGHGGDLSKRLRCSYHISAERVLLEVEDQGQGFDPQQIPDPRAPENLERPSGRGVFLMRYYMTWVRYNERGNCVTLCKVRRAG